MKTLFANLVKVFVTNVSDTSKPRKLDSVDVAKILRNAGIYGVAAALTYLASYADVVNFGAILHSYVNSIDETQANMVLVPVLGGAMDLVLKYFKGKKEEIDKEDAESVKKVEEVK